MPRQRTNAILVIAILHLIGGGLGLVLTLCACGGLVFSNMAGSIVPTVATQTKKGTDKTAPPPSTSDIMNYYNDNVPGYRAFTYGGTGVDLLLDILLLAAGIGLLSVQPWARWLSLVYAPISILYHLGSFVYQLVLVMPATQKLYAQNPALQGMSSFLNVTTGIGLVVGLLWIIYPIVVTVIMLLPSTGAAFRGEMPTIPEDIEEDDARWREPPPASDQIQR
jgi:hypothetical protein